jgi:hypothetical protein
LSKVRRSLFLLLQPLLLGFAQRSLFLPLLALYEAFHPFREAEDSLGWMRIKNSSKTKLR